MKILCLGKRRCGILLVLGIAVILLVAGYVLGRSPHVLLSGTTKNEPEEMVSQKTPMAGQSLKESKNVLDQYQARLLNSANMVRLVGDTTTFPLAEDLQEGFQALQPMVILEVQSFDFTQTEPWWKLSKDPIIALTGEMMEEPDRLKFKNVWGFPPTHFRVASNPLVIIVHPSNPLSQRGITLAELDAVFSQTRFRGHSDLNEWSDLGLGRPWQNRSMILHGYDASNSLQRYMKKHVLQGGDFKDHVHRHSSIGRVVSIVSQEPEAIGITTFNAITPKIRIVPLFVDSVQVAPDGSSSTWLSAYPLPHYIHAYINRNSQMKPEDGVVEFLRFVYSRQGTSLLTARGYLPLSPKVIAEEWTQMS